MKKGHGGFYERADGNIMKILRRFSAQFDKLVRVEEIYDHIKSKNKQVEVKLSHQTFVFKNICRANVLRRFLKSQFSHKVAKAKLFTSQD